MDNVNYTLAKHIMLKICFSHEMIKNMGKFENQFKTILIQTDNQKKTPDIIEEKSNLYFNIDQEDKLNLNKKKTDENVAIQKVENDAFSFLMLKL